MRRNVILFIIVSCQLAISCADQSQDLLKPNILWITIEDLTPMLGCYGDPIAKSPHIDQLANQGVRYTQAFATAAVCSPSRSCILTGIFAPTLGTQHLRSETKVPDFIRPYPLYLRDAGYYCTNNAKRITISRRSMFGMNQVIRLIGETGLRINLFSQFLTLRQRISQEFLVVKKHIKQDLNNTYPASKGQIQIP